MYVLLEKEVFWSVRDEIYKTKTKAVENLLFCWFVTGLLLKHNSSCSLRFKLTFNFPSPQEKKHVFLFFNVSPILVCSLVDGHICLGQL